jgi:3-hydroxyisobutyrate dehydrogenase-like beta-hydroxyacid dehydrogenase
MRNREKIMAEIHMLGFIGVGVMGGRMCRNLAAKSGKQVIAHDVDMDKVAALADAGVNAAAPVADVVQKTDLIFMCLPGEPQVRDVCLGEDGILTHARAGQTVVDMTTATAHIARHLCAKFADKSVDFADAPVARGVSSAEDGTLSIMVGGSGEVLARIKPYLACMGTDITHCGDVGTGQVMKLMNNMIVFQNVSALAEALAIGSRAGVDGALLFETLSRGSADSFALRKHGMQYMVKGEFPDNLFPVTYSLKDLRYALQLAEEYNVDAKGAKLVEQRFLEAIDKGYENLYNPVIYKLLNR